MQTMVRNDDASEDTENTEDNADADYDNSTDGPQCRVRYLMQRIHLQT